MSLETFDGEKAALWAGGVPLTICVAFPSLFTSLLGSWVTLKLGLKQKEWGVCVAKCQPDGGRLWEASPTPLRGPRGPGEPGEGSDPLPSKTGSSKSCIRPQGVLGAVEKRCGHCRGHQIPSDLASLPPRDSSSPLLHGLPHHMVR